MFPPKEEEEFAAVIIQMSEMGFSMTEDDVRTVAYEVAEECGYKGF